MRDMRNRLEGWFERYAHHIYRNRVKALLMVLVLFLAAASQIPKITMDLSTEGFLHENDPSLTAYNAFRDQFGRDELIIIALNPPEIFDEKFLRMVKSLHEELEEKVPHIDDITSIVNARNTRGEGDRLIVEDLLENWPETPEEMATLKQRVLSNPLYKNTLISGDGKFTTIVLKTYSHSTLGQDLDVLEGFEDEGIESPSHKSNVPTKDKYLTDRENSEVVLAVQSVLSKYKSPDFPAYLAGTPVVIHFLKRNMIKDARKFMALSMAAIAFLLFVMFRRFSGVILPLLIVALSVVSTIGIMAAFGVPIKLPTQILPSFLLAVCVGASVHILAIFYYRLRHSGNKEDAIAYALGHSGLAVVMTSFTTAAGLMSFITAEVAPIADIGIFAGIGVLIGLIYTLILLPSLLALVSIKGEQSRKEKIKTTLMDRFLMAIARFSTGHPYKILFVSLLIIVLSIAAASRIIFSHAPLDWFPEKSQIRLDSEKIDQEMRGSVSFEIVADTQKENGLYDPGILNRLEDSAAHVEPLEIDGIFVGKAMSVATLLKEINQALNENQPEFYTIPQDRELVAQEFLLFENSGSDDLEDVVDSQFSKARFTIKVPLNDALQYKRFYAEISSYFSDKFPDTTITITGIGTILYRTLSNAMRSMAKSYVIALIVITILMVLLIGRARIGLLSMIPNLAPILLTMGIMGVMSIHMTLFTMLVGSIAIGLAVDDTIHFMHNFRRYYEKSGDPKAAVYETLQTTGRAMLVTSVVLSTGFFIFTFSTMKNLFDFGLLTSFTIMMALVADYFIAPALMVIVNPKRQKHEKGGMS